MGKRNGSKKNVYEIITERIIELLEAGTVPWQKPWLSGTPVNFKSQKEYRGINVFVLEMTDYTSPYWLTFKQAKELGGQVRKGEKGYPVIYWNWVECSGGDEDDPAKIPFLRYYTVFNLEQIEGIEAPVIKDEVVKPITACEKIVKGFKAKPAISHGGGRAFYRPSTDSVTLPEKKSFQSVEQYYATLFHELGHATGHETRLSRKGVTDVAMFGSHAYSKEELVAEMTSAFLCGHCKIEATVIDNSASYIASWLKRLKDDPKLVVNAAAQAQKAADLILNRKYENKKEKASSNKKEKASNNKKPKSVKKRAV